MIDRHIIAIGGGILNPASSNQKIERYVLDVCGKERPRVCFVPTASGDDRGQVDRFLQTYSRFGITLDVLRFFKRTSADLRGHVFEFDVVHIGGGNTRSMLAVWRHWEFETILREAWERGITLCGSSAGSLCWFESGVTDSVAGSFTTIRALGFLAGSHCPHYNAEGRRPAYQRFVAEGTLPIGVACDDGTAVHYSNDVRVEAVSSRRQAAVYLVERDDDGARETQLAIKKL